MSPQFAFPNASNFKIAGNAALSNVGGNQYNFRTTIIGRNGGAVVHKRRKGSHRCSQFHEIIRGDIFMLQEMHSEEIHEWEIDGEGYVRNVPRGRRTISTAELNNAKESKFTVMTYQGQDARKLWKKDFYEYSQLQAPHRLQLFAINQSEMPALIFYNELIPLDHFFKGSLWMAVYIKCLKTKYMCSKNDLWMDTSKGIIVHGPRGPCVRVSLSDFVVDVALHVLPSTVDMLHAHTCARYFSKSAKFTDNVLEGIYWKIGACRISFDGLPPIQPLPRYLEELWEARCPPHTLEAKTMDFIGGLRFDNIYSASMQPLARWPHGGSALWMTKEVSEGFLLGPVLLENGMIRFESNRRESAEYYTASFEFKFRELRMTWLSQLPRIFNALEIDEVTDGSEIHHYALKPPVLEIMGRYSQENDYMDTRPIYLFVSPLPMSVSELISWMNDPGHYWSFDETGRSRIPEDECTRLGLPMLEPDAQGFLDLLGWPLTAHSTIHAWQSARGFDLTTTDFARHLGYPELEVFGAKEGQPGGLVKDKGISWWKWSWVATQDSDFSACAI
ncbi:hypothetical protein Moror_5734 [Moniliophthora roreri MCA 2997]|uniref:Uncharacterized protein n=1 Tax=Moniliophthora roreri (strain MCA 2997) TaxID=1381753 RepID=V2X4D4_MONRO|nr:hypothetical protein Moror_5734 [Moniliophthora roreri MCA 2997]